MSIIRTMYTGASGLRAHSDALGVVGDNIANVSTVGYKRSRAVFEDVLGRSVAGSGSMAAAGAGSQMAHIQQMWTQGALLSTGAPTDLAITGSGFFVVKGNAGGVDGQFYSRAGQFTIDADGYVVNPNGLRLQGYAADAQGNIGAGLGDLQIEGGTSEPSATTAATITANLDSSATPPAAWDPLNPDDTSNFSTTMTVYDSLGASHDVTMYFRNNGGGAWEWHAMVDGGELTGGTAGTATEVANGTLTFDTDGALTAETTAASTADFLGATPGQAIAFDFGESVAEGGTGLEGSTQFAAASAVGELRQDGFGSGTVAGISIEPDGTVTGVFSNGQRRALGQVALADFANEDGLSRGGEGVWAETDASGQALVGAAGAGGRGTIVAGALEGSNVDLGSEFVDLIAYQRGFSANSRIITTADEMYQELVNIKR